MEILKNNSDQEIDEAFKRRILWCCRRGVKEVEMVLKRFIDQQFPKNFTLVVRNQLPKLLTYSDVELMQWLVYQQPLPEEFPCKEVVHAILSSWKS